MHLEDFFLPLTQAALPDSKKLLFASLPLRLPPCLVEHGTLCQVGDKQLAASANVGPRRVIHCCIVCRPSSLDIKTFFRELTPYLFMGRIFWHCGLSQCAYQRRNVTLARLNSENSHQGISVFTRTAVVDSHLKPQPVEGTSAFGMSFLLYFFLYFNCLYTCQM